MRKRKRDDRWSFHINDWLDNGTFHSLEDDELEEREVTQFKDEIPVIEEKKITTDNYKTTGRFDQFNDEFDASFDIHSQDQADVNKDEVQTPGTTAGVDEYEDEDPYKIKKSED